MNAPHLADTTLWISRLPRSGLKGKKELLTHKARQDQGEEPRVRRPSLASCSIGEAVRTLREKTCSPITADWDLGVFDPKGHNTHLFMSFHPRVQADRQVGVRDRGQNCYTLKSEAGAPKGRR